MLSDRPYMREDYGRAKFSALTWVLCILAGVFVLENVVEQWIGGSFATGFFQYLTVSPEMIKRGFVWTLATHGFIHEPRELVSLGFILLNLYVWGRLVQSEIGPVRFLKVLVAGVMTGAVVWLGFNWTQFGMLMGVGAGISALLVVAASIYPDQPISFFLIETGLRLKHLMIGWLVISVLGLILLELPARSSWLRMAHSAHLGGMLAGWVYFRFFYNRWQSDASKSSIELPKWFNKKRKAETPAPAYKVNVGPTDNVREEIDRILDKINSSGFQSLTAEEKRRLDQARDHLSRR